ncbi:DUF1656 domain-containing protein [Cupriavidus sp. YR651]|uniref:DUF1656 domain-containing protein n=1 Tax=Cupriavidus sp. YR651 TaxID=1855315 RepID=UPI000B88AAC4|nr:DUF1656 domain-containing protein [Cupriavidus sp. YR651]
MFGEFDIYGVFVPALLVWMLIALGLTAAIRGVLATTRFYLKVWHRSLFNVSMYVIVLGIVVRMAHHA